MKCDNCGKEHGRKRFCSNKCKDIWHNKHNARGYGLFTKATAEDIREAEHYAGLDAVEAGWDGHKNAH